MSEETIVNNSIDNKKKALRYFLKYINDLKLHFSLDEKSVITILEDIIKQLKKNTSKKWWSFFF